MGHRHVRDGRDIKSIPVEQLEEEFEYDEKRIGVRKKTRTKRFSGVSDGEERRRNYRDERDRRRRRLYKKRSAGTIHVPDMVDDC